MHCSYVKVNGSEILEVNQQLSSAAFFSRRCLTILCDGRIRHHVNVAGEQDDHIDRPSVKVAYIFESPNNGMSCWYLVSK